MVIFLRILSLYARETVTLTLMYVFSGTLWQLLYGSFAKKQTNDWPSLIPFLLHIISTSTLRGHLQCIDELICFQRIMDEPVPGCEGAFVSLFLLLGPLECSFSLCLTPHAWVPTAGSLFTFYWQHTHNCNNRRWWFQYWLLRRSKSNSSVGWGKSCTLSRFSLRQGIGNTLSLDRIFIEIPISGIPKQ